ncbi:hypothetical protein E4U41_006206, partial [Claviceps citrina]
DSRQTHLALLAADGRLSVYENDQPENVSEFSSVDEFAICARPSRGEELSFKVRFDPNPEPCYSALRAGVPVDSLGLVVAGMDQVKIYRSRDIVTTSYGVPQTQKEFYLAAELAGHRGLVRDVAWAPGNIRGYDTVATACQDGYVRVFRIDTPYSPDDGKSWSANDLLKPSSSSSSASSSASQSPSSSSSTATSRIAPHPQTGKDSSSPTKDDAAVTTAPPTPTTTTTTTRDRHSHPSTLSASLAKSEAPSNRQWSGQEGQIPHTHREISRLDNHRTPVWRVDFDDDGQILGSTGDDGKLMLYRQTPDGVWAKSSELVIVKERMAAP